MIETISVWEEDRRLKHHAVNESAAGLDSRWAETVPNPQGIGLMLLDGETPRELNEADIADMLGRALGALHHARASGEDLFSERNREWIGRCARKVAIALRDLPVPADQSISPRQLNDTLEASLVRLREFELARGIAAYRVPDWGADEAERPYSAMVVSQVLRRNGQLARWNPDKIEIAVRRAFLSRRLDSAPAVAVAERVHDRVALAQAAIVHIEDVQDMVQEELMRAGHFKVAEAYILYRSHRAHMRQAAPAISSPPQDPPTVQVTRKDGVTYKWTGADLRARIQYALLGLELDMDVHTIEAELCRSLQGELSEADLRMTILLNAKALTERDADFAKFAGRMLLTYIYEEVLDWNILRDGVGQLREAHRSAFRTYLEAAVAGERVHPKLLEYDTDRLAAALDPSADLDFDYLGIQTLYDRYLIIDKRHRAYRRLETPQFFWMRVAMGLFIEEPVDREGWVIRLYQLYKSRRFCSSTPTLFNSGTLRSQLSSCYLYKVDDSIESIMTRGIAENAYLSKWAGGLGGSWTAVRGTGAMIKGTNGESQGVIPFLKLHNDQLVAVNQGGKRRGSGCAYLESWHNDIQDFLDLRRNTGDDRRRTHDLNTANWIPDLFMKRMEARQSWTLFRANETADLHDLYGKAFEERYAYYEAEAQAGRLYGHTMPAIELWKQMLKMLFETGHPWITFKDACNIRSPQDHCGVIHSSNLCTEITLNTNQQETAVCNLGSVVLDTHLRADGSLDTELLQETVRIAVRALDNVIDINFYPTEAARTANQRHRPIGLGVMGLAHVLFQKNICWESEEALELNDAIIEQLAYFAYEASSDLAAERSPYTSYQGSKWDRGLLPQDTLELLEQERGVPINAPRGGRLDWTPLREKIARQGMRNSNVMAIAPTATISNIMGTSPCIEPLYKNLFVKSNLSGDFIVLNRYLVQDLKKMGLWDQELRDALKYLDGELTDIERVPAELKRKYATAFAIPYDYIVQAAARRQKWIDQAQSVNLFLGNPDLKTLSHMYRAAWHAGLKTTYYLRTLGASNIEKATVQVKKDGSTTVAPVSAESQAACRLDAMLRGEECEACQ